MKAQFPERAHKIALDKTGRTLSDILVGDSKESMIESCNEFLKEDGKTAAHRCMVAHNAPFDKRFCHATWADIGQLFPADNWMCTMKYSRAWARKIGAASENPQLHTVLGFHNIKPLPGIHDAGSDARNTYLFWKKGMEEGIDHLQAI